MNKRVTSAAGLLGMVLLLAALAAGVVGCGRSDSTTTTAALKTTAEADSTAAGAGSSQTTTAAVTTTGAPGEAGLSATFIETTGASYEQYRSEMRAFGQALEALPAADDPSLFTDVTAVTGAQLDAAKAYVSGLESAIAQLKAIEAPAELAGAHQEVVAGIEALAAATDELVTAAEGQDQAVFDAALTEGQAAVQALQASMEALGSLLGGSTPST